MKTLVVGDIHCKQYQVLGQVDDVLRSQEIDEVVFLGDYVDDWGAKDIEIIESLDYQVHWYHKKTEQGTKVVNLVGNHDWCYLPQNHYLYQCSGYHSKVEHEAGYLLEQLELRPCYVNFNTLFTHAGVMGEWAEQYTDDLDLLSVVQEIEQMWSSFNDSYGLYETSDLQEGPDRFSGPLWCDYREMKHSKVPAPFDQICGHTPVPMIKNIVRASNGSVVTYCDTLSTDPSGQNIGDCSLLLIESINDKLMTKRRILPYSC